MSKLLQKKELSIQNLSTNTYWEIGGPCDDFYVVNSINELRTLLKNPRENEVIIIGNGTNLLFDTRGYLGTIIKLGQEFDFVNILDDYVEVGAGTWIPGLVRYLSTIGFGGLDHCIGIPATMGGLIAMNGGSQRQSISEIIQSVKVMDYSGNIFYLERERCKFNYRSSIFTNEDYIILSVNLNVKKIKANSNRRNLLNILKERRLKFPRKLPNCGSVFKSSPELYNKVGPPGLIIESLGLKGFKVGGAQVSYLHANFIVNLGGATSSDIIQIVNHINSQCYLKYGLKMEAEAIFISLSGNKYPLHEVKSI